MYRRDGVVVRASASQSVDFGFISLVGSYQKTLFKTWYSPASLLVFLGKALLGAQHIRDSVENKPASLLVFLAGCFSLYVADRWWGQEVYPSWWPSLTKDVQTEHELIRVNE